MIFKSDLSHGIVHMMKSHFFIVFTENLLSCCSRTVHENAVAIYRRDILIVSIEYL